MWEWYWNLMGWCENYLILGKYENGLGILWDDGWTLFSPARSHLWPFFFSPPPPQKMTLDIWRPHHFIHSILIWEESLSPVHRRDKKCCCLLVIYRLRFISYKRYNNLLMWRFNNIYLLLLHIVFRDIFKDVLDYKCKTRTLSTFCLWQSSTSYL